MMKNSDTISVEEAIRQAVFHHKSGQLHDAERLYRAVLLVQPNHSDANHNLGILARQAGQDLAGLPFLKSAFETNSKYEQYVLSYADALHATGQSAAAIVALDRFIAHGQCSSAVLTVKDRIQEQIDAETQLEVGKVHKYAGRIQEAIDAFRCALKIKPDFAKAYNNLGMALEDCGQIERAVECYRQAIEAEPGNAFAYSNLGAALRDFGRPSEAASACHKAIEINPSVAEAHCNLGLALSDLRELDEAVLCFNRALSIHPNFAEAHNSLGVALSELGRAEEAVYHVRLAIQLKPHFAEAFSNLGNFLRDLRQLEPAEVSYREALRLEPNQNFLFGDWLHTRLRICDWENIEEQFEALSDRIGQAKFAITPFPLLAISDSRSLQAKTAASWVQKRHPAQDGLPPIWQKLDHQKIRLGYFSADFHEHATSFLMAELFQLHSKDKFELIAFSFGPITGDAMQKRLKESFDEFIDVRQMSDRDVALLARKKEVDIAVDLKGITQYSRTGIFAWRAAPLQVNYLGYPGTMSAPYMDYLIADSIVIPEAHKADYSEKIVFLPDSYQVNDAKRRVSDTSYTRAEMGLPAQGTVFCCFNNNFKILPATFDSWMRILQAVEGSVLWLFEDNAKAARNLRKEAELRGLSADRLIFAMRMPAAEHLARQRLADLFLDTLPYNAHTTASDALWVGLPVLTLIGDTFAGRVAASLLNAIRMPELITSTRAAFEQRAIELGSDPVALAAIKTKLMANRLSTPLFDAPLFTAHIEMAFSAMIERQKLELEPDHIYVGS